MPEAQLCEPADTPATECAQGRIISEYPVVVWIV